MTRVEFFDQDGRISGFCCSGHSVGIGKDDTLFALIDGKVKFERMGKDRKMCSVYAEQ